METIKTLIEKGSRYLKDQGIENSRLDAEVLLESLLGCNRISFYTDPNRKVQEEDVICYRERIKRRGNFEPVAYITGKKEFMGLAFKVTPAVLIPRPDTESVVEGILSEVVPRLLRKDENLRILDLCTGSGAIGLSLRSFLKNSQVTLSDLSEEALEVAKENARALGLTGISFVQGDLFSPFKYTPEFDLIVSNPPYIPDRIIKTLQRDIAEYEPMLALSGGTSGYVLYERIAAEAAAHLKKGGAIVLEVGNGQEGGVAELLIKGGFDSIGMIPDLTGAVRGVFAMNAKDTNKVKN